MTRKVTATHDLDNMTRRALQSADDNFAELYSGGGAGNAATTSYDNAASGLTGDTVQEALDELAGDGALVDTATVVRDTSTPGEVGLVVQTAVALQAGYGYVQSTSATTKQNDFALDSTTRVLSFRGAGSMFFSGFAGGANGRRLTVCNDTTDYFCGIEPESTNSTAADRVRTSDGYPLLLFPGECAELLFSEFVNRWLVLYRTANPMGLNECTDFIGGIAGPFTSVLSGTAAAIAANAFGIDATEKAKGVIALSTGTDTTGRASLGTNSTGTLPFTVGPMLSVIRPAVNTATDGTNTFSGFFGFVDTSGGAFTDGAAYEYRWDGAAPVWSITVADATSLTRAASAMTVDSTYRWCMLFVNADGTRVDPFYSMDGMSWIKETSVTTDLPEIADVTAWGMSVIKSAGTTSRSMVIDFAGYRVAGLRG